MAKVNDLNIQIRRKSSRASGKEIKGFIGRVTGIGAFVIGAFAGGLLLSNEQYASGIAASGGGGLFFALSTSWATKSFRNAGRLRREVKSLKDQTSTLERMKLSLSPKYDQTNKTTSLALSLKF
ncbi:hypothetical protein GCM10023189_36330 [Nibrella saemangeumensis]|uniref:Uncharacterized protein n=1 Tax=Nibrella saemangeumensis TaxID=1084526 RepID=A0ABP8N761_9BACT